MGVLAAAPWNTKGRARCPVMAQASLSQQMGPSVPGSRAAAEGASRGLGQKQPEEHGLAAVGSGVGCGDEFGRGEWPMQGP